MKRKHPITIAMVCPGDPFAMLEGLQDPQHVPSQPASQSAGGIDLDALYGAAPAAPPSPTAAVQNDDPFGLGGLSAPTGTSSNNFGGGLSSWPAGKTCPPQLTLHLSTGQACKSFKHVFISCTLQTPWQPLP